MYHCLDQKVSLGMNSDEEETEAAKTEPGRRLKRQKARKKYFIDPFLDKPSQNSLQYQTTLRHKRALILLCSRLLIISNDSCWSWVTLSFLHSPFSSRFCSATVPLNRSGR